MSDPRGLRLVLFDRTCRTPAPGLSAAWGAGVWLYRGLGRIDAHYGCASWKEGLTWLATVQPERAIAEVQYWGHGLCGQVCVDGEALDAAALRPGHEHYERLCALRARLTPGALVWFRTCLTFGTPKGMDFARAWTRFFGCRAAGHTRIIGAWQSGLHSLSPDAEPHWDPAEGTWPEAPTVEQRSLGSGPLLPHTIHCLQGRIPAGW